MIFLRRFGLYEGKMSENKKFVLCLSLGLWAIGNLAAFQFGIMQGFCGGKRGHWHRIEYIFPGYKIGWWFSQ